MLGHTSLPIYYRTMFSLIQFHKYSLTELENLIPYELDVYVQMLSDYIKEQDAANK